MIQLNRRDFVVVMARHFAKAAESTPFEWMTYAEEVLASFLEDEGIEFADPEYDWSEACAKEYADTDMSYWDWEIEVANDAGDVEYEVEAEN